MDREPHQVSQQAPEHDELPDPIPEFDDWRDAAAFDAGVPRFGEI